MTVGMRSGWAVPLARVATPAALIAAGLTLGTTRAPGAVLSPTTGGRPAAIRELMLPFPAPARSYPFPTTTVLSSPAPAPTPVAQPAAEPAVALPAGASIPPAAAAIPPVVLAAYVNAAHLTDTSEPACKVSWQMLAGIGLIESDNARSGGSANPDWDGVADPPIYGPLLDGSNGTARVSGTGYGAYDGDSAWERAVGPMQILPSTWAVYAADGNHDGIRNPQDIDDATLAASDYLCASSRGLNQPKHLIRALYSYNHSFTYVRSVLTAIAGYLSIDPAKLGINGLPKRPRLVPMQIELPGPPAASSPSPPSPPPSGSPTPSPSPSWTPPPTPTPSPTLPVLPHR